MLINSGFVENITFLVQKNEITGNDDGAKRINADFWFKNELETKMNNK